MKSDIEVIERRIARLELESEKNKLPRWGLNFYLAASLFCLLAGLYVFVNNKDFDSVDVANGVRITPIAFALIFFQLASLFASFSHQKFKLLMPLCVLFLTVVIGAIMS